MRSRTPNLLPVSNTQTLLGPQNTATVLLHTQTFARIHILFLALSVLSLLATTKCPHPLLHAVELIVALAMSAECTLRFVALRSKYWTAPNIADLVLVALCLLMHIFTLQVACTESSFLSELLENSFMATRSLLQLARIATLAHRAANTPVTRDLLIGNSVLSVAPDHQVLDRHAYTINSDLDF